MSGKKILITGANGMLGSSLIIELRKKNVLSLNSKCDITNFSMVANEINTIEPDIIIHTAAYTDVEACEINSDKAYAINTLGTQNLVNCCIDKNILFIYISSTGIYGNYKEHAYNEFDYVKPTTIHHKSKYQAEKIIQNHLSKYLIIRTGWLYGGEIASSKNFVYKRFLESNDKKVIYSDDSQKGNPTYVVDLIQQISILIEKKQFGIFNCVNEACNVSRYDYVTSILDLFDVKCKVSIAPDGMYNRIANVSKNESAINYKLNLLGINVMDNWKDSLAKYIQKLKDEL